VGLEALAGQDRLADEEGGEARHQADHQRDPGEHRRLGGEDRPALRDGGQCRPDGARAVFTGDGEHAEDADGELGQNTPMRLKWVGSKNARSEALILGYW